MRRSCCNDSRFAVVIIFVVTYEVIYHLIYQIVSDLEIWLWSWRIAGRYKTLKSCNCTWPWVYRCVEIISSLTTIVKDCTFSHTPHKADSLYVRNWNHASGMSLYLTWYIGRIKRTSLVELRTCIIREPCTTIL